MRLRTVLVLFLVGRVAAFVGVANEPSRQDLMANAAWRVAPAAGVEASITTNTGDGNSALQLDYNFKLGGGFVVVRRDVDLALAENYRFRFRVRGNGPANDLEFKLVDPSGDSVWWVNRRAFTPPQEWTQFDQKKRHFEFAWGPAEGEHFARLGAIEFAIAAHDGGRGTIWIDDLTYEALPPDQPLAGPFAVSVSSATAELPTTIGDEGLIDWRSTERDRNPAITIEFQNRYEVGGVRIDWVGRAPGYVVQLRDDAGHWQNIRTIEATANGGTHWIRIPATDTDGVRLLINNAGTHDWRLTRLQPLDHQFSDTKNEMLSKIARIVPRGRLPRYFANEQQYWTVAGIPDDAEEILVDESGAVEISRGGPRLEPFLTIDDELFSWENAGAATSLIAGDLPIPKVRWTAAPVQLDVTALVTGTPSESRALIEYCVTNNTEANRIGSLWLAARPFQVLPPWQFLNLTGGVATVETISVSANRMTIDDHVVHLHEAADALVAADFARGEVIAGNRIHGAGQSVTSVTDADELASAALRFDYVLTPGKSRTIVAEFALRPDKDDQPQQPQPRFAALLETEIARWRDIVDRVQPIVPKIAQRWADTWRSNIAYILINADGPAIQPGSRTYERSWIRDGAMTSRALLSAGQTDRVRNFIEWYAPNQFANGKIPCVVDRRGPDPVDEHDSTGEFLFLLAEYARQTGDDKLLRRHYDRVVRAVNYVDSLRQQRMTETYRTGTSEQRACFGLVPESISHEGYSAKPMHSYWDDLWIARGLDDAVEIANRVGERSDADRFGRIRDEFRAALHDSIVHAMQNTGIDFIPGCVELGDFDATSTAIAYFPCKQWRHLPQDALENTFDKYYSFFQARRDATDWDRYTPYEVRLMQTYIARDEVDRAHALADYFFADQRPRGWNHWAEVVYREPRQAGFVGDMPHTWVGSAYLNALRALLVYEDDDLLVLAAGVPQAWFDTGDAIGIRNAPTYFGTLSYTIRARDDEVRIELDAPFTDEDCEIQIALPTGSYELADDSDLVRSIDEKQIRLRSGNGTIVLKRAGR